MTCHSSDTTRPASDLCIDEQNAPAPTSMGLVIDVVVDVVVDVIIHLVIHL